MTTDLVLSIFAGGQAPASYPRPAPTVIQWDPPPSSGHPSWTGAADALREPPYRVGPLLKRLLARYRIDLRDVGRIAVVGFSAGSNNGVRELLRSAADRERIDVVLAVDGLHPLMRGPRDASDPRSGYASWASELEPFAAYARRAARGLGVMVATASGVAAPTRDHGQTGIVLADLVRDTTERVESSDWRGAALPEDYPTADAYAPEARVDLGGFSALWYPGADKAAHIAQGTAVVRDLWLDAIARRWAPGATPTTYDAPAAPMLGSSSVALIPLTAALGAAGAILCS